MLLVVAIDSYALDIDEKLTLRILKTSRSKKTILINRGLEDGLVIGDHAKFFLTDGVIARGLVVKASPSRSVWSLYRIIRIDDIQEQRVVNLKISTPVKVTEDPTRSFNPAPIVDGGKEVIVERSSGDIDIRSGDQDDLAAMREESDYSTSLRERRYIEGRKRSNIKLDKNRTWEFYGLLATQSVSVTVDQGNTTADRSELLLTGGLEHYFPTYQSDLARHFSFAIFANRASSSVEAQEASSSTISIDVGIGGYYHFLNYPFAVERFSLFVGAGFGLGVESYTSETSVVKTTLNGSANFLSATIGGKYYFASGLGLRCYAEFVKRAVAMKLEDGTTQDETHTGTRLGVGISYRW